jgi:hypothetical protein
MRVYCVTQARIGSETAWPAPAELPTLTDALAMQPDSFDVVAVLVPNHLHETVALAAIACGKHVMLEKPIAVSADGARRYGFGYCDSSERDKDWRWRCRKRVAQAM